MTKIQITKEQAGAIEVLKTNLGHNSWDYIAKRLHTNDNFIHEYKPFNDMTLEQIVKSVYEGYEVLNPIFAGSYVRSKESGNIYRVKALVEGGKKAELEGIVCKAGAIFANRMSLERLELLTEEEVQEAKEKHFWKKLGREVGEFRKGDRLKFKAPTSTFFTIGEYFDRTNDIEIAKSNYSQGNVQGFFPAESFVSFEELK